MPLKVLPTALEEVKILEPAVFGDERGFFMESWNAREFSQAVAADVHFVQDNHSRSCRGVIRGLHYQREPFAQAKLVRCLSGAVWDVAVDIRRSSPTFGQWTAVELSAANRRQLWIPAGFAHGFAVLSETADVFYKTDAYWEKTAEGCVRWNDPALGITWPAVAGGPVLSARDAAAPLLSEAVLFD